MKKSLLALAALTAFAGAASAQSSVTLFGIVDLAYVNVKNGSVKQNHLASNQYNSNRLGFRGVEDLGGGLRAGFWLEGAMNNDTGCGTSDASATALQPCGGQNWQRRSTVSLMGGFGELRLGRDYTPSFWNYTVFDPFGTNGPGSMLNLVSTIGSGASTLVRANNTVGYFLPAAGGLYGQVQVAAGEGIANGNKYYGVRLGYAGGPVNVAVAYGQTPQEGGIADDYTDTNVGGSFKIGQAFTLMAQYSQRDFLAADQKTMLVGGALAMGSGTLRFSYTQSDGSSTAFEAKQMAVGYYYDLSKRTTVYGVASQVDNEAGARFSIGTGALPAAPASGFKSTGFALGVRHSF